MSDAGGGVFSDEQRAVFRSAGFWMRIVGWAELIGGALAGLAWVLYFAGVEAARQLINSPMDRATATVQAVGGVVIGVLTLMTAAAFRRAGPDAASVTAAADHLRELYERQVWLLVVAGMLLAGAALVW
jgi:hypothetical protein